MRQMGWMITDFGKLKLWVGKWNADFHDGHDGG
jgi:hypothetical protein